MTMNKPKQSESETITTNKRTDKKSTGHGKDRTTLDQHADHFEQTVLDPVDHDAFFAVLDAPPEPTEALRSAFKRYRHTVASRE